MLDDEQRERDERHLAWVRRQPCCLCGNDVEVEAHHPRVGSVNDGKRYTGIGQKAADKWAVPLCGRHHRELHAMSEREFWASYGFDPFAAALRLRLPGALNQRMP